VNAARIALIKNGIYISVREIKASGAKAKKEFGLIIGQ